MRSLAKTFWKRSSLTPTTVAQLEAVKRAGQIRTPFLRAGAGKTQGSDRAGREFDRAARSPISVLVVPGGWLFGPLATGRDLLSQRHVAIC
jgi:hypothetical protein